LRPRAVVFDIDGVLVDSSERFRKAMEEQLRAFGIEYDEIVFRPEGDYSKNHEFKARELAKLMQRYAIEAVYDDSEAVVEAVSRLGIKAHLAGQGELPEVLRTRLAVQERGLS